MYRLGKGFPKKFDKVDMTNAVFNIYMEIS